VSIEVELVVVWWSTQLSQSVVVWWFGDVCRVCCVCLSVCLGGYTAERYTSITGDSWADEVVGWRRAITVGQGQ